MELGAFRWQGYTEPQTKSPGTFTSPPTTKGKTLYLKPFPSLSPVCQRVCGGVRLLHTE